MKKYSSLLIAASVTFALGGCASTTNEPSSQTASTSLPAATVQQTVTPDVAPQNSAKNGEITLKQIMSDPQWMGALPEGMGWSVNGDKIVFEKERQDSALTDVYVAELSNPANAVKAPLSDLHKYRFDERVVRNDGVIAYSFEDSV
ncbi:MAG: S9 family peptidase, partial [Pseudomonadota bacterium]|nr:S9 family peptidase [Pseudomonadota bacterium]